MGVVCDRHQRPTVIGGDNHNETLQSIFSFFSLSVSDCAPYLSSFSLLIDWLNKWAVELKKFYIT